MCTRRVLTVASLMNSLTAVWLFVWPPATISGTSGSRWLSGSLAGAHRRDGQPAAREEEGPVRPAPRVYARRPVTRRVGACTPREDGEETMVTRDTAWDSGTPCWVDLGVDDMARARAFYGGLFGWDLQEGPPEAGGYTMCELGGRQVAGIGAKMGPAEMPSVWTTYIASSDAD